MISKKEKKNRILEFCIDRQEYCIYTKDIIQSGILQSNETDIEKEIAELLSEIEASKLVSLHGNKVKAGIEQGPYIKCNRLAISSFLSKGGFSEN